jgi:hypothetical protein
MSEHIDLQPANVRIRHVKLRVGGSPEPGEVLVVGRPMVPQAWRGINGEGGWVRGGYVRRRDDDGEFKLSFPNDVGGDGTEHLQRMLITNPDVEYEVGDEWFEVYEERQGILQLLFVGTPTDATITNTTITVSGIDGGIILVDQHETAAGQWNHAPRDAFRHYTGVWAPSVGTDFTTETITSTSVATAFPPFIARHAETADGRVILRAPFGDNAYLEHDIDHAIAINPRAHWRFEVNLSFDDGDSNDFEIAVGIAEASYGVLDSLILPSLRINPQEAGVVGDTYAVRVRPTPPLYEVLARRPITELSGVNVVVEGRGRWIYYYINGNLLGVDEQYLGEGGIGLPYVALGAAGPGPTEAFVRIDNWLVEVHTPLLSDDDGAGDSQLPGVPGSGGLLGEYFDDNDIKDRQLNIALNPTRKPYARRVDATIADAPPPTGPASNLNYSYRLAGAIYLPLSQGTVQITRGYVDACRLWIGATLKNQEVLDDWVPGAYRYNTFTVSGTEDGWYPIVIEGAISAGPGIGGRLLIQTAAAYVDPGGTAVPAGGPPTVVPMTSLSPYGIYNANVRYDSHAEQLRTLVEQFAIQWTTEPRSLESGHFPGVITPRVRVGQDTDVVVDPTNSVNAQTQIKASGSIDMLLVDAQGLADPNGAAQTSIRAVDYRSLDGRHLFSHTGYESIPDLARAQDVKQRASSMLALRRGQWQEIAAEPDGRRQLAGTIPAGPGWIEHRWLPGDGVRVAAPRLGINDPIPRAMLGIAWDVVPDGISRPQVTFRQRPRSNRQALRRVARTAFGAQRNYQTQITTVTGTLGSTYPIGVEDPDAAYFRSFSNVPLPRSLLDVIAATLIVSVKENATVWNLEINDTDTGIPVDSVGHYDVTGYLGHLPNQQRLFCRLIPGGTGTGGYVINLVLNIRI